MRVGRILTIIALIVVMTVVCIPVSATDNSDIPYYSYDYTYWGEPSLSPSPYIHEKTIWIKNIAPDIKFPTDIIVNDEEIIISDTQGKSVLGVSYEGELLWQINEFNNKGEKDSFVSPSGLALRNDFLYVCDTENSRILKFDSSKKLFETFEKPKIDFLDENYEYMPIKIAVDKANRMYVVAQNINQGIIILDKTSNFKGFIGAPKVKTDLGELIWRVFSTKKQKKAMKSFVPTEYNNLCIDDSDFIYVTTSALPNSDVATNIFNRVKDSRFAPVKKLNPSGIDVMMRNGSFPPSGDIRVPNSSFPGAPVISAKILQGSHSVQGHSEFVDVSIDSNGIYNVLDKKRGRVFTYDHDGDLLFAFGSYGSRSGSLSDPVAIENDNGTIYILNSAQAKIDVFKLSDYGKNVISAVSNYRGGKYEQSKQQWQDILIQNNNFELAHLMIGKVHIQNADYKDAMESFKKANNKTLYSKAFQLYSADIVEKNFVLIIALIILIIILIFLLIKAVKKLSERNDRIGTLFKDIRYAFYVTVHPFDGFYDLKHEKRSKLYIAISLLISAGFVSFITSSFTSFHFTNINLKYINIPYIFFAAIMPLVLFVIANWSLTTIMDGKGNLRDIIIFTGYSQLPALFLTLPAVLLTHFISLEQNSIFIGLIALANIWIGFLIIVGTMVTHSYSMKKTIFTLITSVFGIILILFLLLLILQVSDKITGFIKILLYEIQII